MRSDAKRWMIAGFFCLAVTAPAGAVLPGSTPPAEEPFQKSVSVTLKKTDYKMTTSFQVPTDKDLVIQHFTAVCRPYGTYPAWVDRAFVKTSLNGQETAQPIPLFETRPPFSYSDATANSPWGGLREAPTFGATTPILAYASRGTKVEIGFARWDSFAKVSNPANITCDAAVAGVLRPRPASIRPTGPSSCRPSDGSLDI